MGFGLAALHGLLSEAAGGQLHARLCGEGAVAAAAWPLLIWLLQRTASSPTTWLCICLPAGTTSCAPALLLHLIICSTVGRCLCPAFPCRHDQLCALLSCFIWREKSEVGDGLQLVWLHLQAAAGMCRVDCNAPHLECPAPSWVHPPPAAVPGCFPRRSSLKQLCKRCTSPAADRKYGVQHLKAAFPRFPVTALSWIAPQVTTFLPLQAGNKVRQDLEAPYAALREHARKVCCWAICNAFLWLLDASRKARSWVLYAGVRMPVLSRPWCCPVFRANRADFDVRECSRPTAVPCARVACLRTSCRPGLSPSLFAGGLPAAGRML